jgi:hypothetical protein
MKTMFNSPFYPFKPLEATLREVCVSNQERPGMVRYHAFPHSS